jgi:Putative rhamnosyl transferase
MIERGSRSNPLHLLVTRFNIRWGYEPVDSKYSDDWMSERIALFERYTLPSVQRQTNDDFRWIILLDEERCRRFPGIVELIERSGYVPMFCEHLDLAVPQIREYVSALGPVKHIATSRLDCDDVLHPHYIADLKAQFRRSTEPRYVVDFPFVAVTSEAGRNYGMRAYWRFPSAFLTLVEPFDDESKTAFGFNHFKLRGAYPEHLIEAVRTMIVIHGGNCRNAYPDMIRDIVALMRHKPATAVKLAVKWIRFDPAPFGQ